MPKYRETLLSLNPILLAQVDDAPKFIDHSSNQRQLQDEGLSYTMSAVESFPLINVGGRGRIGASGEPDWFLVEPTTDYVTLAMVIHIPSTAPSNKMIMGVGNGQFNVYRNGGVFGINTWSGDCTGVPESKILNGKWNHLVLSFNLSDVEGTMRAWLNGKEETVIDQAGGSTVRNVGGGQHRFHLGGGGQTGTFNYNDTTADISSVAYYDRQLTEEELTTIGTINLTGLYDPLAEVVAAKNPRVYWKFFANDTPNKVNDCSLYDSEMTLVNGHTVASKALPVYKDPTLFGAVNFTNTAYGHSTNQESDLHLNLDKWTLETWFDVKAFPTSGATTIASAIDWGSETKYILQVDAAKTITFQYYNSQWYSITAPNIGLDTIYHVVVTYGVGGYKIYLNGVLVATDSSTTRASNASGVDQLMVNGTALGATRNASAGGVDIYELALYRDTEFQASDVSEHWTTGSVVLSGETEYKQAVLADNPIAYYPCDIEPDGGSVNVVDVTGNTHNMAMSSGSSITKTGGMDGTPAYNHGSATDANTRALLPVNGNAQMSFEGWFKRNANSANDTEVVMSFGDSVAQDGLRYTIEVDTLNNTVCAVGDFGPDPINRSTKLKGVFELGQWYHVALSVDLPTDTVTWWLNGQRMESFTVQGGPSFTKDYYIVLGGNPYPTHFECPCLIQHIAVYDKVLTDEVVSSRYRARVALGKGSDTLDETILTDTPIGYWKLDEQSGTTFKNYAGRYPMVLTGNSIEAIATTGMNRVNSPDQTAPLLDGVDDYVDVFDASYYTLLNNATLECMVEFSSFTDTGFIGFVAPNSGFALNTTGSSGSIRIWHYGTGWVNVDSTKTLQLNTRYHIALTVSNGQVLTVWVNGEQFMSHDFGTPATFSDQCMLVLGANSSRATFQNAKYSHVAVYDHILTTDRILDRFIAVNSGFIPGEGKYKYADLVASDDPYIYLPLYDQPGINSDTLASIGQSSGTIYHPVVVDGASRGHDPLVVGAPSSVYVNNANGNAEINSINFDAYLVDMRQTLAGTFTFEGWIQVDDLSSQNRLMGNAGVGEATTNNSTGWLNILSNGSVEIFHEYSTGTNLSITVAPAGTIEVGKPYHLVVVRDNAAKQAWSFVNGVKHGPYSYTTNPEVSSTLPADVTLRFLGDDANTSYFVGYASDLAVYDKVLPDGRIIAHYLAGRGYAGEYETLIASKNPLRWFKMDDSSNLARDYSLNEAHGTWANGTPVAGESICPAVSEYSYDGTGINDREAGPIADIGNFPLGNVFSFECWVQPKTQTQAPGGSPFDYFILSSMVDAMQSPVQFTIGSNNYSNFKIQQGGSSFATGGTESASGEVAAPTPTVKKPNHLVFVYNNPTMKVYQNGKLYHSYNVALTPDSQSNPWKLFGWVNSSSGTGYDNAMIGKVSNIVIYDTELTDADVSAHWEAGLVGNDFTLYEKEIMEYHPSFWLRFDELGVRSDWVTAIAPSVTNGTVTNVPGKAEGALEFTGAQNIHYKHITNDSAVLQTIPMYSSFTATIWVNIDRNDLRQRFYDVKGTGTAATNNYGWQISMDADRSMRNTLISFNNGSQLQADYTVANIDDGEWHHLALVFDTNTGTMNFYIDGSLWYTETNASTIGAKIDPRDGVEPTVPTVIGGSFQNTQYTDGRLADPMFFRNKVMGPTELTHLMNLTNPRFSINGTVTEDGVKVERTVRIYRRDTGELVKSLTSVGGKFDFTWFNNVYGTDFYVVALDDQVKPLLDPIARDHITVQEIA